MGKSGIPDRWMPYSPMGTVVSGTRFIACKVPLREGLLRKLPEHLRFGPKELMDAFPNLGLLIDLTNTTRYYDDREITDNQIQYEKIFCPGKVIPPNSIVDRFFEVVDRFLRTHNDSDSLIAVHCTHGVNRTGYFICRYMIQKMDIKPDIAVESFQEARGHDIERKIYVDDLKGGCKGGSESDLKKFCPGQWKKQRVEKRERDEVDIRNHRLYSGERMSSEKRSRGSERPETFRDRSGGGGGRTDRGRIRRGTERSPPPSEPGSWRREQVQQKSPLLDTPYSQRNHIPPNPSPHYRRDAPPMSSDFWMTPENPRSHQPRPFFPERPPHPRASSTSTSWGPRSPSTSWRPLPPFNYSGGPGGPLPTRRVYTPQNRFPRPEEASSNPRPPLLQPPSYPKMATVDRISHGERDDNQNSRNMRGNSNRRRPRNNYVR